MIDNDKRVDAHWENYVKPLLEIHGEDSETVEKIGFHYRTSGKHFYKHCLVDYDIDPNKIGK